MFQAFADWLKRRRDCAELGALDADERGHLARDLGVGAAELDYLVRESHDPQNLPRMMAAIGIDESALRRAQATLLRDMERVCGLCTKTTKCRHELADGVAGVTYPSFCPNAPELTALNRRVVALRRA